MILAIRIVVVVASVLLGLWLAEIPGILVGAVLSTVFVTETQEVIRAIRHSAKLGGSGVRILWRAMCGIAQHALVRRVTRAFVVGLFVSLATALGNELAGRVGAILSAAFAAAIGQSVSTRLNSQDHGKREPIPTSEPPPVHV